MKKTKNKRWRLFADFQIQGRLCLRLAVYWLICQCAMLATLVGFASLTDSPFNGAAFTPALVVSTCVLPILMFDLVAFSNRFAGPLLNLNRKMKQLAETNSSDSVGLRDGDFYQDMASHFNTIREKVITQSVEKPVASDSGTGTPVVEITLPQATQSHV